MPGRRDGRDHRPPGRFDLPHHLVARSRPQSTRKQRRAPRPRMAADGPGGNRTGAGPVLMAEPRLFLDADGVLADFDGGVRRLLGMSSRAFEAKHGRGAFWKRLANAKNFYGSLAKMPDARLLFDGVKHLRP